MTDEILAWAEDWYAIAGDGFKAEMLFLAYLSGAPPPDVAFAAGECQAFARWLYPHLFPEPTAEADTRTEYDRAQAWACYALLTGAGLAPPEIHTDPRVTVHSVLWASRFGADLIDAPDVIAHLTPYLSDPDDDLHAMAVLGLVICGQNPDISRCMDIADLSPTPETYHAIAVAQMAQLIDPE